MKTAIQRFVALLLVAVMASSPLSVLASTEPDPPTPPPPPPGVALEVLVAADIVEAEELQKWMDEEGRGVLAELPDEVPRRGTLHVAVDGALYQYEVSITASRDDAEMETQSVWRCECSNEDLLKQLRVELSRMADVLVESTPPATAAPRPPPPPRPPSEPVARRISVGEVIGLTVMGVGIAGVAAGATLMSKGATQGLDPGRFEIGLERDYARPGVPILVAGAGAVATGLVAYLLQRAGRVRRVNMAIVPTGPGIGQTVGVVLSGRIRR